LIGDDWGESDVFCDILGLDAVGRVVCEDVGEDVLGCGGD
jgi:hypothetical protein